jgi:hypothetical protein
MAGEDPSNWRLDVPQPCIDLYTELVDAPRPLDAHEAATLVQLIDAWRDLEHRKHIALKAAGLTEKEAFDAMIVFLDAWFQRGGKRSDDLAGLLGDLTPGLWEDGSPNDPAQWPDWQEAVRIAVDPERRPDWLDLGSIQRPASE